MARKYFEDMPVIEYPYLGFMVEKGDGKEINSHVTATDMSIRYRIRDEILNNEQAYYTYIWKDSDRPDIVADQYYGHSDYAWIVLLSGQIFDWMYDLPQPLDQFKIYVENKYNAEYNGLANVVHHWEYLDGTIIDHATYIMSPPEETRTISVLAYEQSVNESKREVKLVSRTYRDKIEKEYKNSLKKLKSIRSRLNG